MFKLRYAFFALTIAALALPGYALELGEPAPALKLSSIVKGGELKSDLKDLGEVYVVEFWATWCGPCRQSIPHLTEMQKKFKDKGVTIIGISDEEASQVEAFVENMGDQMEYTVALDEGKSSWEAYAEPFGVQGIPHAFVVDKAGALVWHGHPLDEMFEEVVAGVVDGTYDLAAAKAAAKKGEMREELSELTMLWAQEYIVLSRYGRDKAAADAVGKKLLECGFDDPVFYGQVAWTLLSNDNLAYKNDEFAMSVARLANELSEGKSADVLDTLAFGLFRTGKKEEAIATQKKAIEICENDELMAQLKERLAQYEGS